MYNDLFPELLTHLVGCVVHW